MDAKVKAAVKEALAQVADALECACCFQPLAPGAAVAFECGHTYCNRQACASSSVTACPECRQPIGARVLLFGVLASAPRRLTLRRSRMGEGRGGGRTEGRRREREGIKWLIVFRQAQVSHQT